MKGAADLVVTIIIGLIALGLVSFTILWIADKVMRALDWLTRFE